MTVRDALEQLDAIHDHLTRSEEYRGFRAAGVAVTGVLGLAAAVVQPFFAVGPESFVTFWVVAACICAAISVVPAISSYVVAEDEFDRRRTRRMAAQFVPCVLVGGAITAAAMRIGPGTVGVLPGIWALVFGLGLLSARPYLPAAMTFVVWFFLAGGAVVLGVGLPQEIPPGWTVGGIFGPGHLAAAWVLARGQRESNHV